MSSRERNDILPEHNEGMTVIPQILTNQAEDFLSLTKELREYGYDTVNLNLGCPSGTVVAKRRGSGLLAWPNTLDAFLDEIFSSCDCRISIKTRLGTTDTDEWEDLLTVYDKYPLEELIIHPRIQKDFTNTHRAWSATGQRMRRAAARPATTVTFSHPMIFRISAVSFRTRRR